MRTNVLGLSIAALLLVLSAGCATAPKSTAKADELNTKCDDAIAAIKRNDPTLEDKFFKGSYGYAVFPTVAKGGLGVGGAGGKGQVYQGGKLIGYTTLSQGSIGLQIGGQSYTEIIFFEHAEALNNFKKGQFALAAQATAVAVSAGAGATADYDHGVAVFTTGQKGLMAEASVGGQQFDFEKLETAQNAMAKD